MVGFTGTLASYQMKMPMMMRPRMRGTKTDADDHGCWTPPNVKPVIASVVPDITIALPLQDIQDK